MSDVQETHGWRGGHGRTILRSVRSKQLIARKVKDLRGYYERLGGDKLGGVKKQQLVRVIVERESQVKGLIESNAHEDRLETMAEKFARINQEAQAAVEEAQRVRKAELASAILYSGPWKKTCPSCAVSASSEDDVRSVFGLRSMKRSDGYQQFLQSRCKKCRRSKRKA